jgi:hypothetical protein
MLRWEAPMGDAEGDLAGPWPGNAPELLVRAGIPVGVRVHLDYRSVVRRGGRPTDILTGQAPFFCV